MIRVLQQDMCGSWQLPAVISEFQGYRWRCTILKLGCSVDCNATVGCSCGVGSIKLGEGCCGLAVLASGGLLHQGAAVFRTLGVG
jgi:hypothetical protein